MSNTPITASAEAACQRLADLLATLPQDRTAPPAVLALVHGISRSTEPLTQFLRGTGDPTLLFRACAVLQETLDAARSADPTYPGVALATAGTAQSLGMLSAAIQEHGLVDPSTPRAAPTTAAASAKRASARPRVSRLTVFPQTAVKVPVGPNGLPRLEAEVDTFSETNFFTNVAGDVRDRGGLFVATYAVLAVHTPCEVALKFPGGYLAELRGVVKWRDDANAESTIEPGIGIEITEATDEVWSLILRFVENREPIVRDA